MPKVRAAGAFFRRTDSVTPVIAVGEAAAGKSHDRWFDLAHFINEVLPDAMDIRYLRFFAHPNSVVNDSTQILDKVAIGIRRNFPQSFLQQNLNTSVRPLGKGERRRPKDQRSSGNGGIAEKFSAFHEK